VEAVDARTRLAHGLAVEAAAIEVGQLLPVVLLVLIWVIVVRMRLLWLRGPAEETKGNKEKQLQRYKLQGKTVGEVDDVLMGNIPTVIFSL